MIVVDLDSDVVDLFDVHVMFKFVPRSEMQKYNIHLLGNQLECVSFSFLAGKSDLTVDALKLHNDLQAGPLELGTGGRKDAFMEEEPDEAISERTAGTFLSGLSDCSNLTFRKVQRLWESNSAAHKEVHFYSEHPMVAKVLFLMMCGHWCNNIDIANKYTFSK